MHLEERKTSSLQDAFFSGCELPENPSACYPIVHNRPIYPSVSKGVDAMQYFQGVTTGSTDSSWQRLPAGFRNSGESGRQNNKQSPGRVENRPKVTSHGRLSYNGNLYASRSEAACAILMERYIPGFKIKDGKTFQIPLGVSSGGHLRTADFMVQGVLVEYHPPRIHKSSKKPGDFKNWEEYDNYRAVYQRCTPAQKETLKKLTEIKLTKNYTEKRLSQMAECPRHRGRELLVLADPVDLYEKVLKRFGGSDLPDRDTILREFRIATRKPQEIAGSRKKSGKKRENRRNIRPNNYQRRRRA